MRDLTSYFPSKILNESTNSPNIPKDENSSSIKNVDKKRQYDRLLDESASVPVKHKNTKMRKRYKHALTDSEENVSCKSAEDSSDSEPSKKLGARKKLRRKSSSRKKERATKTNTSVTREDKNDTLTSPTEKDTRTSRIRHFESVVIKDCMNSSLSTASEKTHRKNDRCRRKRTSKESEQSETDSSGNLFEDRFKERLKTYSKKSATRIVGETNNLFNYFSKAEKPVASDSRKLEDSPIDCLKQVKVLVQVHSPPKDRGKKSAALEMQKKCLSPVVKLYRTEAIIKSLDFDSIEVIETESINLKAPETKPTTKVRDDEDSDSSVIFKRCKRPKVSATKLVFDDSDSESVPQVEGSKSKETKTKKNVSFFGLKDTPEKPNSPIETGYSSNHSKSSDSEGTPWKMRVQFASKTKTKTKSKKPQSSTYFLFFVIE